MNFFGSKKMLDDWLTLQGMDDDDIFRLPAHLAFETARAIFSLEIPTRVDFTHMEDA